MKNVASSCLGIAERICVCDYDIAGEAYTLVTEEPRSDSCFKFSGIMANLTCRI